MSHYPSQIYPTRSKALAEARKYGVPREMIQELPEGGWHFLTAEELDQLQAEADRAAQADRWAKEALAKVPPATQRIMVDRRTMTAADTFMETKRKIDGLLNEIEAGSYGYFGRLLPEVTWFDVCDLKQMVALLEAVNRIARESAPQ